MPSHSSGARPIDPTPQTPQQQCLNDLYARIEQIIERVNTRLTNELNRPDLTLSINGRLVEHNGVISKGFENVTGLTQPLLTPQEREIRLAALIAEKTGQLLARPPAIVADYSSYIQSFGVSIANNPGDPGFSPSEMKRQSEVHLRERITEEVDRLTREKFDHLALSHLLTPPPPTGPDLNPLLDMQRRILDSQEALRSQQADQHRQQQQQQQEQNAKKPEQTAAENVREQLKEILRPNIRLDHADIYKWIEKGLSLSADPERLVEKLQNTGLIKYTKHTTTDVDTGQDSTSYTIEPGEKQSGYFKVLRTLSFGAWGATLAASGMLLFGAAAGPAGLAAAVGTMCVINAVNLGVQSLLKKLHTNTFANTWKEIQHELGTMDPKRAPALAGLMYLLVDKYSPIVLASNRTQFWQWGQPLSTQAVLDHLKEASAAAINHVAGTTEGYYKGIDVKEKLSLAKTGLDNLEKRWNWHWDASSWWAATLTSTSFLGTLAYGATAFF